MLIMRLTICGLISGLLMGSVALAESRVNILFKPGTSDAEKDRALVRSGADKIKSLAAHEIVTAHIPNAKSRAALKGNGQVLAVGDDLVAVIITTNTPTNRGKGGGPGGGGSTGQKIPTGVKRIGAYPTGNTGANVIVALVDTGIDLTHPDLAANIVGNYNAINSLKTGKDDNGHGSHVAGTVAALDNEIGVLGVAPNAKLLAIKVLDASGSGYLSDVAEGIGEAVSRGAQVINMSLGYATKPAVDPVESAVNAAALEGVILVCAAGNSGPASNTVNYPAKYPNCIAVAAWTDTDGTSADVSDSDESLASFSSRGPEVFIAAPGVSILSTWKGGGTKTISGTSMASPHVAGAVARLLAAGTTPADVKAALSITAEEVIGTPDQVGIGLVRVQAQAP